MKVLGDDWAKGLKVYLKTNWGGGTAIKLSRGWGYDTIPLDQIEFANMVTQENQASVGRALGWGAVGALALGPLGLLAALCGRPVRGQPLFSLP
jgi:hypothetical protein